MWECAPGSPASSTDGWDATAFLIAARSASGVSAITPTIFGAAFSDPRRFVAINSVLFFFNTCLLWLARSVFRVDSRRCWCLIGTRDATESSILPVYSLSGGLKKRRWYLSCWRFPSTCPWKAGWLASRLVCAGEQLYRPSKIEKDAFRELGVWKVRMEPTQIRSLGKEKSKLRGSGPKTILPLFWIRGIRLKYRQFLKFPWSKTKLDCDES